MRLFGDEYDAESVTINAPANAQVQASNLLLLTFPANKKPQPVKTGAIGNELG